MHETSTAINQLEFRVQHMYDELKNKLNQCALLKDLNHIQTKVDLKADQKEIVDQLQQKASKQSVQTGLAKKASKSEVS